MAEATEGFELSRRDLLVGTAAVAATVIVAGCSDMAGGASTAIDPATVPAHGMFEASLKSEQKFENPFWDTEAAAEFISPSGKRAHVDGFFYAGGEWRVRYVPSEPGRWRYEATLRGAGQSRPLAKTSGQFICEGTQGHGFLRPSTRNRYRMEYEDGTPFYPIGVQTCNLLKPDCDGPNPDGSPRSVTNAEWVEQFAGACNLVRTQLGQATKAGCAFPILPIGGPPDRYDTALAKELDDAFTLQRKRSISQILILFQDMSLWGKGAGECIFGQKGGPDSYKRLASPTLPLQEKYIRYIVARYAAFTDIWEIFNEDSFAEADYLDHLAKLIRKADPYRHPITTNYAHPAADWCEIVTFHEYMGMPANEVDAYLASQFAIYKAHGKVVQNTEFGNQKYMPNVDPIKWRIAVWTAFMHECSLLFWSMSYRRFEKPGEIKNSNANAYLGPDSRQHFRVLDKFTRDLPIDLRPTAVGYTTHRDIRLYGMTNGKTAVLYVHHFADHNTTYQHNGIIDIWTGPGRFRCQWIDPATGDEVATATYDNPQQFLQLEMPPIKVDLACRMDRLS